jgi:hypothetical protein
VQLCRTPGFLDKQKREPTYYQNGSKAFGVDYLVNICLVRSLAKCITVIDVGNLLQHFAYLLCELQIGCCTTDGNLYLVESVTMKSLHP